MASVKEEVHVLKRHLGDYEKVDAEVQAVPEAEEDPLNDTVVSLTVTGMRSRAGGSEARRMS